MNPMLFPPFEPDRNRRFAKVPLRLLLPNIVTLLALCSGLTAIRLGIEHKLDLAIYAIVLAAVLDTLDGRVARLLKSTSRFGAELDSLTDFVNFGCAPALLLYVASLQNLGSVGWIAVLVFAIAAALRLARFNIALDDPNKPDWAANFFVGVPAPAGAITVLLPIYLEFLGIPGLTAAAPLVFLYTLAMAFLMVSRVPTWSGKRFGRRIPRDIVLPLFVLTVLTAALLVSFPWVVLTLGTVAYLAALPFGARLYRRYERESPPPLIAPDIENGHDDDPAVPADDDRRSSI